MADTLPELDTSEVDQIIGSFKDIYQSTSKLTSARVCKIPNQPNNIIVSEWVQCNLERLKPMKILRYMMSDSELKSCVDIDTIDVSHWMLNASSKSGKFRAVIHGAPNSKSKGEMKYYLEIWSEQRSIATFDLTALDLHGDVYTDKYFSSISWSAQEDRVIYIAEEKKPKTSPFYEQTSNESSNDLTNDGRGEQFVYKETWGNALSPIRQPVIVSCEVDKKKITILQGVPQDVSPGQTICDPNGKGVVGVGFLNSPRRLGLSLCTNRKNHLFYLSYEGEYSILSDEQATVILPSFSPDGKYIVWFQRPQSGPHHGAHSIMRYDCDTKVIITIIDVIQESILTENHKPFYGIYGRGLPGETTETSRFRCWTSDSKYFLFTTDQKYCAKTFAVNIENGNIWDLDCGNEDEDSASSAFLLSVSEDDYAILNVSSFKQSCVLTSLHIPSLIANYSKESLFVYLTKPVTFKDEYIISNFTVQDVNQTNEDCFATYYGPRKNDANKSTSLIVFLHGGPHFKVINVFTPEYNVFIESGFGVLFPHYHGSTGIGQKYVESLPGNMGYLEVEDCYNSMRTALKKFPWLDPNQVVVLGGSSGGFIMSQLISRYPNEIKSAVMRNPVTDVYLRCFLSDMPDWTTIHFGFPYKGLMDIINNPTMYQKMIDISPVRNIKNVTAPTLLFLSTKDLRVPLAIGLAYHHMLKERNVPTKVLIYEESHMFVNVSTLMDWVINAVIWYKRCFKQRAYPEENE